MKKIGNIMIIIGMCGLLGIVIYACFMESFLLGSGAVFGLITALGIILNDGGEL